MKSNAIKMMIFLLAAALLCFGTTMTVSAMEGGDDESAIEVTTDDGAAVEAEDGVEATDEETTDEDTSSENGEEGDGDAEGDSADEPAVE